MLAETGFLFVTSDLMRDAANSSPTTTTEHIELLSEGSSGSPLEEGPHVARVPTLHAVVAGVSQDSVAGPD